MAMPPLQLAECGLWPWDDHVYSLRYHHEWSYNQSLIYKLCATSYQLATYIYIKASWIHARQLKGNLNTAL